MSRICLFMMVLLSSPTVYGQLQPGEWSFPFDRTKEVADTIDGDISAIKRLNLKPHWYKVSDLPVEQLVALEYLNLGDCQVDDLNQLLKKISFLPNLQYLSVESNYIDSVFFYKGAFPALKFLSFRECRLKYLDSSISELKQLEYLNIGLINSRAPIANNVELPTSFSQLSMLRALVYENNDLKEFPACILELNSLERLNLRHNSIKSIPLTIRKLTMLKEFDISYNLIEELPIAISNLDNLRVLGVRENKLKCIPVPVLMKDSLKLIFQ